MIKNTEISETKRQILDTAQKLFVKYNYGSVSMNDIAGKLNLSKPALYHHFKNKEELYITILKYTHEKYLEHIKKIIDDKNLSLKEKFQTIITSYLTQHNEVSKNKSICSSMILMQKMSKYHKNITDFVRTAKEEAMKTIEPMIKEMLKEQGQEGKYDPKLMFLLVSGAMNAYIVDKTYYNNKSWTSKQVVEHLTGLVFKN